MTFDWELGLLLHRAFDGGLEGFDGDRLDQVLDEAGLAGALDVLLGAEAGDDDALGAVALRELAHEVVAGSVGEADVADEQIKAFGLAEAQRGLDAFGGAHAV